MISKRAQSVDSSGIRRVFDLAANLSSPIDLSIGQPDFDAWPEIKQAAIRAINEGHNGYVVTQGIEKLRGAIRKKYALNESSEFDVGVTSGVSGGVVLSYMALLDPGDEVLIPDPFFCIYRDLAKLISATPTFYDCYPDFKLPLQKIEQAITPRTKAILLNSPSNPTGYAASQAELDAVIELARAKDLWVIYDEIYDEFVYDSAHAQCFGRYNKLILLNSFSKSYGVAGWRVGYAVAPKEMLAAMMKVQQYSFVNPCSVAQWGVAEAFNVDVGPKVADYKEKRDFMYLALKDKFELVKPGGAFYLFPKSPTGSATEFVEKCIANNLLVIPGNVFSNADTHFRISFAAPLERLERGVEVLRSLV